MAAPPSSSWRRNYDLSELAAATSHGGRLQPRPAVATYDTRTLQRKPSQQPLARKDRPPLLQSEIAAIHEHLDALEARSRAVDEGVHARLEVHSGELASVTQRTDAIEQIQRQAATQAATQAEAVASMATDLQVLASHAEGTAVGLEQVASAQREASVAKGELGVLRTEVNALKDAVGHEQARSAALEKALETALEALGRLGEQHSALASAFAAECESGRAERQRLADAIDEENTARAEALASVRTKLVTLSEGCDAAATSMTAQKERMARLEQLQALGVAETRRLSSRTNDELTALKGTLSGWANAFYEAGSPERWSSTRRANANGEDAHERDPPAAAWGGSRADAESMGRRPTRRADAGSPPPFGWLGPLSPNTLLADTTPDRVEALAVGLATTLAGVRSGVGCGGDRAKLELS